MKRVFRQKLNFSKSELLGAVHLGASGISMPLMTAEGLAEYKEGLETSNGRTLMDFGWAGNDPKFYEGLTAAGIQPKPEDFLEVPFRLISATIVGGGSWKATDFSDAKVLRKSTKLLDGVPLYKDHETDLDNWVGLINGVKWTEGFTDASGVQVPAGIDGIVAIDAKTNPKVARGVAMGAIYSNSVTVEFDWEMSHTFENEWDFLSKLGSIGSDGKMVRRMVKAIHNYHESSLVWLGADPFAKAINEDGSLKNIDIGSVYSYTKASFDKMTKAVEEDITPPENAKLDTRMTVNFAIDKNVLTLARKNTINNQKDDNMKKFLAAFMATFGTNFGLKEGEEPTEEQLIGYMKQLSFKDEKSVIVSAEAKANLDNVTTAALEAFKAAKEENKDATAVNLAEFMQSFTFVPKDVLSGLEAKATEVETLTTQVTQLSESSELGKKYLQAKRNEAVRLYKVAVGEENVVPSVVELFKEAKDDALDGLLTQYTKGVTQKFKGTCASCGSGDFKFQSSFSGADDDHKEVPSITEAEVSAEALYQKYSASSMNIGRQVEDK